MITKNTKSGRNEKKGNEKENINYIASNMPFFFFDASMYIAVIYGTN